MKLPVRPHSLLGVGGRMGLPPTEFSERRELQSQTGHRAIGTTNQSSVVKREVMAGFLMGFSS